jgi:capsid protein
VIGPNGYTPPPPSALDRFISWVSPEMAAKRRLWRTFEASYKGGAATRTSEYWQPSTGGQFGSSVDRMWIGSARDRAFQAYDNNPVAATLVDVETENVVGDGLNYQPMTKSEAWNREAIDRYYEWLENCSVQGADVETGMEIQQTAWSDSRIAGDGGWVLVSRGAESRLWLIAAEDIATPDEMQADPNVYDGIRYDADAKPVAFYIRQTDDRTGKRTFATIPARDFVYLPHKTKKKQGRPPSCYIRVFDLLAHLDRYVDGVSLAAWMATVFGIVFKKTTPSQQFGQLPLLTNSQGEQQRSITLENGSVKYVGVDEEVAQVQAHQPMAYTDAFIRQMLRNIGMPFRMPLEVVALDMSTANFASARIGLLPFYRRCRIQGARFGSRWSRTIRWWLSRERLRAPDDPKRWRTEFPEDYWTHELRMNAWTYTDPISEAQGDHLEIGMGTKSPQMVIAERGRDLAQIMRDREEWQKLNGELPILHSTLTRDPMPPPGAAPAPNEETEDDDDTDDE